MIFLSLFTALLFSSPDVSIFDVKVMTYNIHHAEGMDGEIDVDRIARIIRESGADIVCLQEVDQNLSRTGRIDMPSELADALDMNVVFGANYHFDDGHYGNLTLSRFPILESENIELPNPHGKEPRGCLRTLIEIPTSYGIVGDTAVVCVMNTHLGLLSDEREEQAKHIVDRLPADTPVVVAGDLNERTDGTAIQLLLDQLIDADKGVEKSPTSPSRDAVRRIDYILHWRFNLKSLKVMNSSDVDIASDHLPVVAEMYLKR